MEICVTQLCRVARTSLDSINSTEKNEDLHLILTSRENFPSMNHASLLFYRLYLSKGNHRRFTKYDGRPLTPKSLLDNDKHICFIFCHFQNESKNRLPKYNQIQYLLCEPKVLVYLLHFDSYRCRIQILLFFPHLIRFSNHKRVPPFL